jgi:hypothetical protein
LLPEELSVAGTPTFDRAELRDYWFEALRFELGNEAGKVAAGAIHDPDRGRT